MQGIAQRKARVAENHAALAPSVLEQTAEPLIVCDTNEQVILANQAARELSGQDPVAEPFRTAFPLRLGRGPSLWRLIERREKGRPGPEVSLGQVLRGETVRELEVKLHRRDEEPLTLLMSASPLHGGQGEIEGCIITLTDITQRKRTEEAVQESDARFTRLAASNVIGIISADSDVVLEANDAFLRMMGYSREDLFAGRIRWRDVTLSASSDKDSDEEMLAELTTKGSFSSHQIEFLRKDGSRVPALLGGVLLESSPFRWAGFVIDQTDRVRTEEALRRREEQFRALAENSPDLIDRLDQEGRHLYVNPAASRLMGIPLESSIGKTLEETGIPQRLANLWREHLDQVFNTGNATELEFDFPTEEGIRFFQSRLVPEFASDGSVVSVLMASRDFTDLKQAEEALQEANLKLEIRVNERTAELTKANESLQESRAQFQALLESAPDATVTVNAQGEIVLVNDATEKMFGYRRKELMGHPVEFLLPDRFRHSHVLHRQDYHAAPTTRPMGIGLDLAGRRKDGTEFPVEISLSPVSTKDGVLVTSIIRDITDRRRSERALREQAARLQEQSDLLQLAHDAILVRDLDHRILFWNHGAQELYGWTEEEAVGQITHLFLKTQFPEPSEQIESQLLTEGRWEGELWHSTRDGRRIVVASRQVLHRDAEGRPRAILEINRDMTKAKQAEEALRSSEDRLRTLIQQVKDYAIFGIDPEGRVVSWNEGAQRITGYRADEIIGQHFSRFYPPEDIARGKPERELKIAVAEGMYKEEGERLRKDGTLYWAEVVITALRDPEGRLRGFAKVTRDITERKHAEEQIKRLNQELEHRVTELAAVNQELEAFSYSVSHDLRSPLRGIAGFSQALLEDYADTLDPTGQDYARRIHAATQRMTQLIDDLLNLSRVTRSEMSRETPVDLSAMVQSIASQLQSTQPERAVDWVITSGLVTHGDPRLLRIALENLIGNAWKFASKRERARIEFGALGLEEGKTIYFVRDNGAGFEMQYADKLFGPFQRLHSAGEFPGTGIGLATVQRIIHRHGGRIWAESAVNQGSTFFFTLP